MREDDWLGGEAWNNGTPNGTTTTTTGNIFVGDLPWSWIPVLEPSEKTQLAKELLLVSVKLSDLAEQLDSIRGRLEKL